MLTGGHPCEHGRTGERSNLCKNRTSSKGRKTTVCIYQDAGNECDKLVGRDKMILLFPLFFSLPLNESFSHRQSRLPEQETQLSCHKRDQEMYS